MEAIPLIIHACRVLNRGQAPHQDQQNCQQTIPVPISHRPLIFSQGKAPLLLPYHRVKVADEIDFFRHLTVLLIMKSTTQACSRISSEFIGTLRKQHSDVRTLFSRLYF